MLRPGPMETSSGPIDARAYVVRQTYDQIGSWCIITLIHQENTPNTIWTSTSLQISYFFGHNIDWCLKIRGIRKWKCLLREALPKNWIRVPPGGVGYPKPGLLKENLLFLSGHADEAPLSFVRDPAGPTCASERNVVRRSMELRFYFIPTCGK